MGRVIRVGIIGFGRSGRGIHAAHLATSPRRFRVVAVADAMPERRSMAAAECGCETYPDLRGMLLRRDIDLIVNAGPSHLHAAQSLACLEAGFHVLCEKPVARKISEIDALRRAARRAGRVMAAFHNSRFFPVYRKVCQVVDSGVLGRLVLIKAQRNVFRRRWDWQTLRSHCGGNLMNVGQHQLDQLIHLAGLRVEPEVTCFMDRVLTCGDAEDHVKLLLRAPGHPVLDLEVSSCCAYPQDTFSVYGSRGGLRARGRLVEWKFFRMEEQTRRVLTVEPLSDALGNPVYCSDDIRWHEKSWQGPDESSFSQTVARYYDMLYRTLTGGAELPVTLDEVRLEVGVVEECLRQNPLSRLPAADLALRGGRRAGKR